LFEVIRQSTITGEGNSTKDAELAQFEFFAKHTQHRAAGAMPFVKERMKVRAVLDVFLCLVEQDGGLKLLDGTEQRRRGNASGSLWATCHFIQEAKDRGLAAALGR
jgi:hypothetical protein